jgi:hypothetical protein
VIAVWSRKGVSTCGRICKEAAGSLDILLRVLKFRKLASVLVPVLECIPHRAQILRSRPDFTYGIRRPKKKCADGQNCADVLSPRCSLDCVDNWREWIAKTRIPISALDQRKPHRATCRCCRCTRVPHLGRANHLGKVNREVCRGPDHPPRKWCHPCPSRAIVATGLDAASAGSHRSATRSRLASCSRGTRGACSTWLRAYDRRLPPNQWSGVRRC